MRCQRTSASASESWRAWPMCSAPVTFGGGCATTNAGRLACGSALYGPSSSQVRCQRSSTPSGRYSGSISRARLAADRVPLHSARVRRAAQLPACVLDGRHAAQRPVGRHFDLVASLAQARDDVLAEAAFELERAQLEAAWVERRDQVVGAELGCVDRLLQVEATLEMAEEDVQCPLVLVVAARRAPREPGLPIPERET